VTYTASPASNAGTYVAAAIFVLILLAIGGVAWAILHRRL
jgi:hypothetical protein